MRKAKISQNGRIRFIYKENQSYPEGCVDLPDDISLLVPVWNGEKWIEGQSSEHVLKKLEEHKIQKILELKGFATQYIYQNIATEIRQRNWILFGQLDTSEVQEKLARIQKVRDKVNEVEALINGKRKIETLQEVEIPTNFEENE